MVDPFPRLLTCAKMLNSSIAVQYPPLHFSRNSPPWGGSFDMSESDTQNDNNRVRVTVRVRVKVREFRVRHRE